MFIPDVILFCLPSLNVSCHRIVLRLSSECFVTVPFAPALCLWPRIIIIKPTGLTGHLIGSICFLFFFLLMIYIYIIVKIQFDCFRYLPKYKSISISHSLHFLFKFLWRRLVLFTNSICNFENKRAWCFCLLVYARFLFMAERYFRPRSVTDRARRGFRTDKRDVAG